MNPRRRYVLALVVLLGVHAAAAQTDVSPANTRRARVSAPSTPTTTRFIWWREKSQRRRETTPATPRRDATARDIASWLGRWQDPWLGEVAICPAGRALAFTMVKPPRLREPVRMAGPKPLLEWGDGAATDAWLEFKAGTPTTFAMRKIDNTADFSSDFKDLASEEIGDCPQSAARASQAR